MNTRLLAVAVATLLPLAGVAADKAKPTSKAETTPTVSFDSLDANKDGRISMPEASADPRLVEAFSSADKNGDGYLDNAEYQSIAKAPKQQ